VATGVCTLGEGLMRLCAVLAKNAHERCAQQRLADG